MTSKKKKKSENRARSRRRRRQRAQKVTLGHRRHQRLGRRHQMLANKQKKRARGVAGCSGWEVPLKVARQSVDDTTSLSETAEFSLLRRDLLKKPRPGFSVCGERLASARAIKLRDQYVCRYCYRQLTRSTATSDHVAPDSGCGESTYVNQVCSCRRCNNIKGNFFISDLVWAGGAPDLLLPSAKPPPPFPPPRSCPFTRPIGYSEQDCVWDNIKLKKAIKRAVVTDTFERRAGHFLARVDEVRADLGLIARQGAREEVTETVEVDVEEEVMVTMESEVVETVEIMGVREEVVQSVEVVVGEKVVEGVKEGVREELVETVEVGVHGQLHIRWLDVEVGPQGQKHVRWADV